MSAEKLVWKSVNVTSPKLVKLANEVKVAQAALTKAKQAFEVAAKAAVVAPKGQTAVFSFKFGKVAVAFTAAAPEKSQKEADLTI